MKKFAIIISILIFTAIGIAAQEKNSDRAKDEAVVRYFGRTGEFGG